MIRQESVSFNLLFVIVTSGVITTRAGSHRALPLVLTIMTHQAIQSPNAAAASW